LINLNYCAYTLEAKCGVVITIYREFAHYCRRMQEGGVFHINQILPTESLKNSEIGHIKSTEDRSIHSSIPLPGEEKHREGSYQAEEELYGVAIDLVNGHQARFLTTGENWGLFHDEFRAPCTS